MSAVSTPEDDAPVATPGDGSAVSGETHNPAGDNSTLGPSSVDSALPTSLPSTAPKAGQGTASAPKRSRFRILNPLGRGGMGQVYLAQDERLGRPVALKLPRYVGTPHPELLARFEREGRAAAQLTHPCLCRIYDVADLEGQPCLVMEYVEGRPLSEVLATRKPFPVSEAVELVSKLATALAEAHARGVIHRDLKPSNIIVRPGGEPVVVDFGLAKLSHETHQLTSDQAFLGTLPYMSPEQARGESSQATAAMDIYSLGIVLYELLTGRTPFKGPPEVLLSQIASAPVPPLESLRPEIDGRTAQVCVKALSKSSADRPTSMQEFADDLKRASALPPANPGRPRSLKPSGSPQGLTLVRTLDGHRDRILQVAWSANGRQLASCSDDGQVIVWDRTSGEKVASYGDSDVPAGCLAWSPDGAMLAAGRADGAIHLWSTRSHSEVVPPLRHSAAVRALAWVIGPRGGSDGANAHLISGGDDWRLIVWRRNLLEPMSVRDFQCCVTSIAVSLFDVAAVGTEGGTVSFPFERVQNIHPDTGPGAVANWFKYSVADVAWGRSGRMLAVACSDGAVRKYTHNDEFWVGPELVRGHTHHVVSSVSFSADERILASKSSRDNTVRLWDAESLRELACLEELGDPRLLRWHSRIAFHPTQRILATFDNGDQSIRIWSIDPQALGVC